MEGPQDQVQEEEIEEEEEWYGEGMGEEGAYYEDSDLEEARAEAEAEAQARKEEEARHQARIEAMAEAALPRVRQNGLVLEGLSPELQNHRDVVLAAVKNNGEALRHAGAECRADREIVLQAVKSCGEALAYANLKYRADREVVHAAVCNDGMALRHAEPCLCDEELALAAMKSNPESWCLNYVQRESNADILLEALKTHWASPVCEKASRELLADEGFMLKAAKANLAALEFAAPELLANRAFILKAMDVNPAAFAHASQVLRAEKELVMTAIYMDGANFSYAGQTFRSDKDLLLLAFRNCQSDTDASQCYYEADESVQQQKTWQELYTASWSSIAIRGQDAPTLSVTVTHICDDGSNQEVTDNPWCYHCEVVLMSGTGFSCRIPDSPYTDSWEEERPGPSVNDLATAALEELPKVAQAVKYAFFIFSVSDDEALAVSVWDWNRLLSDFVRA